MKTIDETKPVEIRVEENGGVRVVDMDAFFAQPKVQDTLKLMKRMDLAGKKLNGNKIELQGNAKSDKILEES